MPEPTRALGALIAVVGLLTPALAPAWTPYGYGQPGAVEAPPSAPMRAPAFGGSNYSPAMPFTPPQGFGQAPMESAPAAAPQDAPDSQSIPPLEPSPFAAGSPAYGPGPSAPTAEPGFGAPPSGYGMGGPPSGYYGPGYGPGGPFAGPEGFGMPPAGFPGRGGYGYGADRPGIQVSRRTTEDAYILDIQLRGMRPDEVQVRAQGRWISIDRVGSAQEVRQEQFDEGRGYARSFTYSSGSASRRMSLPPDADASAMQREDGESSIRIRFPRTDRGMGYGAPPQR